MMCLCRHEMESTIDNQAVQLVVLAYVFHSSIIIDDDEYLYKQLERVRASPWMQMWMRAPPKQQLEAVRFDLQSQVKVA